MLYGSVVFYDLLQGIYSHLEVVFNIVFCHDVVAGLGLDALRYHRLVGDKEQGSGRNVVGETADEQSGGFHIHTHCPGGGKESLEMLVVLPKPSVGGEYSAGPVVFAVVSDG